MESGRLGVSAKNESIKVLADVAFLATVVLSREDYYHQTPPRLFDTPSNNCDNPGTLGRAYP